MLIRYPFLGGPMKYTALVLAVLLVAPAAIASEEMYLGWAEVRIVGQEHDVMGRVVFSAGNTSPVCSAFRGQRR